MARSSIKQIADDETKIINELKKNARESIDTIAEKCGFSRQKVWRIMNKLEDSQKIWGYTAVTDEEKLGNKRYFILIKRTTEPLTKELAEKIVKREVEKTAEHENIIIDGSHFVHGNYDWIISFLADDTKLAKKLCDILQNAYYGYIADIILLENLFSIRKNNILNPNKEKLNDFL
jgi:DNA-binding Lrp family transcriptional regulator